MNIIDRIASRSLKASKLKNAFVIFTIILATAMMIAICLYFVGDAQRRDDDISDRYQGSFLNMTKEKINTLKKDPMVDKVGLSKQLEKIEGENYSLNLTYMDLGQMELNRQYQDLKGQIPIEKNEIVIMEDYAEFMGEAIEIGDTIKLGEGSKLQEFVVCGIMSSKSDGRDFSFIVSNQYVIEAAGDNTTYSAYIRLSGVQELTADELRGEIEALGESMGCGPKDIIYSSYYFTMKNMDTRAQQAIITITYVVIILACALVIYSIFYISVISKMNEYGRLRTIGADRKQVKAIIRKEANKLSVVGIPMGVLLGGILSYFIMPDVFDLNITTIYAIIISLIVYLMVKAATSRPGKMAAAVPPIMAVKNTGYEGIDRKKITKKERRNLKPINLAYISVMRNKKKAILTMCSLGFCGILLMGSASYLESISPEEMAKANEYPFGEFKITFLDGMQSYNMNSLHELQDMDYFDKTFLDAVASIDGVVDIKEYKGCISEVEWENGITEGAYIDIVSEEQFERLRRDFTKGDMTYQEFTEEKGLILGNTDWKTIYGYEYDLGDSINFTNSEGVTETYKVMAFTDYTDGMSFFYASDNKMEFLSGDAKNGRYYIEIKTDPGKLQAVEKGIRKLVADTPDLEVLTLADSSASYKAALDNQTAPMYLLVLFIAVFGVVNMMNTLFTNVVTRKSELSVYQTIGLSNKQLRNMLLYEGMIYFIGIAIITLSLGTVVGIVMCAGFDKLSAFGRVVYRFPGVQVSIYLLVILSVIILCSIMAVIYYRHEPLVERMRSVS